MNMHMLDLMYAPTDWLSLMLMPQFMGMEMDLYQPYIDPDMVGHLHAHPGHKHATGGIGDTGMYALVKLFDSPQHHIHTSLGFTASIGDVNIKLKESEKNLDAAYIHYGMQLGSGTWDFKPSLTYTGKVNDWSWGAQVGGTLHLEDSNSSGYALGDFFETSIWGGYDLTHWLSATVRAAYTWQGSIKNQYTSGRLYHLLTECKKTDFIHKDSNPETGEEFGPNYCHPAEFNQCLIDFENSKRSFDALDLSTPHVYGCAQ